MAEETVFSNLFPAGIVENASKIVGLKNKLDKSIPMLLFKNGFSKMYNETKIFFNDSKRLILFYDRRESKSKKKRSDVLSKCIELKNKYPNETILIGYLIGTDTVNQGDVILQDMTFKIMVGESLLRFLLPYDEIIQKYKTEIDEYFGLN